MTSLTTMDKEKAQRIVSVVKKRMRSGSQEESENKRLKDLFDGDLTDFLTLLDTLESAANETDISTSEPEVSDTGATVNKEPEKSTAESLNIHVLKEPTVRNDLLEIFAPLFKQLNSEFKSTLTALQAENEAKDKKIADLTARIEVLESQQRRKNLRIHGVEFKEGEDTSQKVCDTVNKHLKIKLKPTDIDECFRLNRRGLKPTTESPILVKLNRYEVRRQIFSSKKLLKDSGTRIFINEDLPKSRADLFKKARQLQKDKLIWKTWTNNSRIFFTITRTDALPKEITDDDCIGILKSTLTPLNPNGEPSSSLGSDTQTSGTLLLNTN